MAAARYRRTDCVALLLPFSEINQQDLFGWTALHYAADAGSADCLSLLLPFSNPHLPDFIGSTPLMLAAQAGHLDCVQRIESFLLTQHEHDDLEHHTHLAAPAPLFKNNTRLL